MTQITTPCQCAHDSSEASTECLGDRLLRNSPMPVAPETPVAPLPVTFKHFDIDPEALVPQDSIRNHLGMLAVDIETSVLSPTQARQRMRYDEVLRDALKTPSKYKALHCHEKVFKDYGKVH